MTRGYAIGAQIPGHTCAVRDLYRERDVAVFDNGIGGWAADCEPLGLFEVTVTDPHGRYFRYRFWMVGGMRSGTFEHSIGTHPKQEVDHDPGS